MRRMAGRFRQRRYCFSFGDHDYRWEFSEHIIQHLIPGALRLPRRGNADPDDRVVRLDMRESFTWISRCYQHPIPRDQLTDQFEYFLRLLRRSVRERSPPKDVAREFMEDSLSRHDLSWGYALVDFCFITLLLRPNVLEGSQRLRDGLDIWLEERCNDFTSEAPLPTSLKFIDMCSDNVFEEMMDTLMSNLRVGDRDRLILGRGNIALPIDGARSQRLIRFLRHRYPPPHQERRPGERQHAACSDCDHSNIRPRQRRFVPARNGWHNFGGAINRGNAQLPQLRPGGRRLRGAVGYGVPLH